MGGSAPQVPVPNTGSEISQAQQANLLAGEQSQAASNVNQITPFGSLSYQQTGTGPGGIPTYTATTQLSPQEQAILNPEMATQAGAATQAGKLLQGANYGGSNPIGDINALTAGYQGGMMGGYLQGMEPFFGYQQEALNSQLANQGLTPGSPAYAQAQNLLEQNQAGQVAQEEAQFQPAAYSEALQSYGLPLQTASGLFNIGQPASLSENLINTPTSSITAPDVLGAYQQALSAEQTNAQLQEQQYGSMLSGMFGLGAAGIKALPYL
jgi:hypothetical protein